MLNWYSLADRLVVGVPVMIACVVLVLVLAYAEERARKARARKARARKARARRARYMRER